VRQGAARAALAALLLAAGGERAVAQVACAGQPIRSIRIHTNEVFSEEESGPAPAWVADVAQALSWRTRAEAVRADLLFHEGDGCNPARLRETARLLRERPNLRSASITTLEAPDSEVDVVVITHDDWSLGASVSARPQGEPVVRSARITEANLLGAGVLGRVRFDNAGRRAGLIVDFLDPHLFGRDYLEVLAGRSSIGPAAGLSLSRPFDTEVERTGWHVGARYVEDPFGLADVALGSVVQPVVRSFFDVSGAWRIGQGRRPRAEIGISVLESRAAAIGRPLAARPQDDSLAAARLAGRFAAVHRLSANLILGVRALQYEQRSGLDAVHAVQDVARGLEVRMTIGRGFEVSGMVPDQFALLETYVGADVGRALVFARGRAEGLRPDGQRTWQDVIASGDAYAYVAAGRRGRVVVGVEAAGGWNTKTPFQLALGAPQGVRGFSNALPVGRRVVMQAEYRHYAGTLRHIADIGWAAFLDAGRGWAGDAPLAQDVGTVASVGGGLRLALPPGSQFVARLDAAVPVAGGHGVELRFSLQQQFGILHPEPVDVMRSRQPPATLPPFNTLTY
jgi:hypothetical protein